MAFSIEDSENMQDTTVKQGHSCCFFCCDVRRAVMIMNIISVVSTIIDLAALAALPQLAEDEETKGQIESLEKDMTGIYVVMTLGLICSLASLYGVWRFNYLPVAFNALFMIGAYIAASVIESRIAEKHDDFDLGPREWFINAIILALVGLYPHVMLVLELRSGIMTPETYATREKQSCCCV